MAAWDTQYIPDQAGKIIVVTGATSGIGLAAATTFAERGARVVLAVRDKYKGERAAAEIRGRNPNTTVSVEQLDLTSLASVAACAARIDEKLPRVDVLVNNAGLGKQPRRSVTVDGFEQQFGVNHLGHFALTAQLVPALLRAGQPRVVTVASVAHRRGRIRWNDPNFSTGYKGNTAYSQSKLANLMFALELAARAKAQGSRLMSLAAHPGLAMTGFIAATGLPWWMQQGGTLAMRLIGQSAEAGSWPPLYAATMADVRGGDYWGPRGFKEIAGAPTRARVWPHARKEVDWRRLWDLSEKLTGITFPALA